MIHGVDYELTTDGVTVWINSAHGVCLARFGRGGVDVHTDYEAQAAGKTCLRCSTTPDWGMFVEAVRDHHGIDVPEAARPRWCDAAAPQQG